MLFWQLGNVIVKRKFCMFCFVFIHRFQINKDYYKKYKHIYFYGCGDDRISRAIIDPAERNYGQTNRNSKKQGSKKKNSKGKAHPNYRHIESNIVCQGSKVLLYHD